jgi:GDP-mannose 6-dehydrogenase
MRITVLGLGYVGAVVAGCLARRGHEVIGVDTDPGKVQLLNAGRAPIIEPEIGEITAREVAAGRLAATTDVSAAIPRSDLIMICVGTPSQGNGGIDLSHVRRVCQQIGAALPAHPGAPVIVVRSTLLPGTVRDLVIPTLEASSGRQAGVDFGVCVNPEFLREGSAVHDYLNPPKTVIGELNRASGDLLASLYTEIAAPLIRTDIETAEMVKYADNAWHALKVGFANEMGHFCKSLGVDSHRVMDIFCRDTKLNLSACYLKPGFAFGGSCLPKDLKALLHRARSLDVSLPILSAVLPSNELQIERAVQTVIEHGSRKVGILGLSFKAGSDDLRNSPVVELAERLLGKGFELRIFDANVSLASIHGTNRDYIMHRIPHISALLTSSIEEVLEHAGTLVIGNAAPEFRAILPRVGFRQTVVDLVRIGECHSVAGVYEGVCW